ncbi:shematrin-like protein 2 [Danaus plexippus]|uniref:shematrin-like protein 2 n=1 Tax=Danaus plexippus TaxID=13037 RepID=UPI002AB1458B|nr:shematrin-like protein 2 [Danaus plexippus]
MKLLSCVLIFAVAVSAVSGGYIRSGWSSPSYGYSAPLVYSRPYSYGGGWNSGHGGWNSGYSGWNGGWNGGWKGW